MDSNETSSAGKQPDPLKVEISPTALEAWLTVPAGYKGIVDQVVEYLHTQGVIFGLNGKAIEQAVEQAAKNEIEVRILVAQGRAAVDAEDGHVEIHFGGGPAEVDLTTRKSVDLRETGKVVACKKDQVLANLIFATESASGRDVRGKEVFPTRKFGKSPRLRAGRNVRSEAGAFIAMCDGMVEYSGSEIHVLQELTVPGDVDYSIGNIRFPGKVIVRGSVKSGFIVQCDGDLNVNGNVEDGKISAGGDITIGQGICGEGKSVVICKKSIRVGFVENSTVEADGDLIVKNYIMHSHVSVNGWVRVLTGKGAIIGGEVSAGHGVEVKIIGSDSVRGTTVSIGGGVTMEKKLQDIDSQIAASEEGMKRIRLALGESLMAALLADPGNIEKLPAGKREAFRALLDQFHAFDEKLQKLQKEKNELNTELEKEDTGSVKALEMVYPGSVITIGHLSREFKDEARRSRFVGDFEEKEIRTAPL